MALARKLIILNIEATPALAILALAFWQGLRLREHPDFRSRGHASPKTFNAA
jgi:hypothetical protein